MYICVYVCMYLSRTLTFPFAEMKSPFIPLNTPIPSSAAVECVFPVGKEILRPKRAGLSDKKIFFLLNEEFLLTSCLSSINIFFFISSF